jgi:hypothetical protein
MNTAILGDARIVSVDVTDEGVVAHLADGRIISMPLEWSWRLRDATPEQRAHWEIIGDGQGVHWPDVDEDISIEGMVRGVPAKRPSRTEMRILLDASSLIDAEHREPVSFDELDRMLREHHARLILTYTSTLEFVGPFDVTMDHIALRDHLQQIERLPVGYIRERGIMLAELREAVAALKDKRECHPIDPYVKRWDETVRLEGASPMAMLVNQSLYDCVSSVLRISGVNPLTHTKKLFDDPLRAQFENDRKLPAATRNAIEKHFRQTIHNHVVEHSLAFPPDQVNELADWIYSNPAIRCPGYRLAWEVRRELANNITQKVSGNDMLDIGYALGLPYIDAMTMDRNKADLCRRVSRRLRAENAAINYEERIFTSLKDLLEAKF